jgi:hypothetical protein
MQEISRFVHARTKSKVKGGRLPCRAEGGVGMRESMRYLSETGMALSTPEADVVTLPIWLSELGRWWCRERS